MEDSTKDKNQQDAGGDRTAASSRKQKQKTSASHRVHTRTVLVALMEVRRRGSAEMLKQLEKTEPDLAEYLMESLSDIHHAVLGLGVPPRRARRIYGQVETLVLTCTTAMQSNGDEAASLDETATPAHPDPAASPAERQSE